MLARLSLIFFGVGLVAVVVATVSLRQTSRDLTFGADIGMALLTLGGLGVLACSAVLGLLALVARFSARRDARRS